MLALKVLTTALLGASAALADGAAVADAISTIQDSTLELANTVASWDGGILGALPIIIDATSLLGAIKDGTATAEDSATFSDVEAATVGVATISLVTDVNSTLTTLIAAKPKFDKGLLTGIVLLNLEAEKSAAADFSDAVVSKLPATFTTTGEQLAGQIAAAFDQAIDVFSGGIL